MGVLTVLTNYTKLLFFKILYGMYDIIVQDLMFPPQTYLFLHIRNIEYGDIVSC